jgi:hypothetical protein
MYSVKEDHLKSKNSVLNLAHNHADRAKMIPDPSSPFKYVLKSTARWKTRYPFKGSIENHFDPQADQLEFEELDHDSWTDLPRDYVPDDLDFEVGRTPSVDGVYFVDPQAVSPVQLAFSTANNSEGWNQVKSKPNKPGWIDALCDSGATCNLFAAGNGKPKPAERPFAKFGSGNVCPITHACDSKFVTRQGAFVMFRTKFAPRLQEPH